MDQQMEQVIANYEDIINLLGQEIAEKTISQAVLRARMTDLEKKIGELEKLYNDSLQEVRYYKDLNQGQGEVVNE